MCLNYLTFDLFFNLYYSGSKSMDSRKRRKVELKRSGVSNKNKAIEEDGSDVQRKDKKIKGEG